MGRAPCCEKMGLKKGPWTTEEDLILVTFINQHGHGNWRNLPKRAGLLRCGKSCRLRWMNYLRPDIKRGNFTKEEEESIMKLHQELGNRWSVIAARLPGRTDNEIKNVWHTHLKKKLLAKKFQPEPEIETQMQTTESSDSGQMEDTNSDTNSSPPHSSSEISSLTGGGGAGSDASRMTETFDNLLEMDESFWSEVFSGDDSGATSNFSTGSSDFDQLQFSNSTNASDLNTEGSMDFWYNLFNRAEGIIELPHDF